MKNPGKFEKIIGQIAKEYKEFMLTIEEQARQQAGGRAYGGILRAAKGEYVENLAKTLIYIAWQDIGGKKDRLGIRKIRFKMPIKQEYIEKIKDVKVKDYTKKNIDKHYYKIKTDVHVYIDKKFVLSVECKAYTENAMIKRILVDFSLLKLKESNLNCALFQLESQLGGDYSSLNETIYGSPSTHTLLSYFNIDLHIITLLKGERKVDRPIHQKQFYKPLEVSSITRAIDTFSGILEKFV